MFRVYEKHVHIDKVIELSNEMIKETNLLPNQYAIIYLCNAVNLSHFNDYRNGIKKIKNILNEHIFNKNDLKCFDTNEIKHMSKSQLLHALNLWKLCVCIKIKVLNKLDKNDYFKTHELCSFPIFQLKNGYISNFSEILLTVNIIDMTKDNLCLQELIKALQLPLDGLINDTNKMIVEYRNIQLGIKVNREILTCILNHYRHG